MDATGLVTKLKLVLVLPDTFAENSAMQLFKSYGKE
jgi:hypothetical protein